jgi:DNA primase
MVIIMGKTYIETIKYLILADFKVKGIVEKPDIIGAVFGQSEGLLGSELDIKELQQNGKIGRIDIDYKHSNNTTTGVLKLPCSVSMVETAIIGASIETIEKVGPCDAYFKIKDIEDTRGLKRKLIKERAINLLGKLMQEQIPDTRELMDEIVDTFKTKEIINFGPDKLAAGPTVSTSKDIIIVEGRADVLNLLKYGFTNVLSTGGARIPISLQNICRHKNVTLFLDGDHGGDIQLSQLLKSIKVDYITRAPDGKEVEELTQKEINQALRKKIKTSYYLNKNGSRKSGIIKETKFSVTNEHKVTAPKLKNKHKIFSNTYTQNKNNSDNRDYKKYNIEHNSQDNTFDHMLSEIPNVERVDISKNNYNDHKYQNNYRDSKDNNKSKIPNNISNYSSRKAKKEHKDLIKKAQKIGEKLSEHKNTTNKLDLNKETNKEEKKDVSKDQNTKKGSSKNAKDTKKIKKKSTAQEPKKEVKEQKIVELPKLTEDLKKEFVKIYKELKPKNRTRILNEKLRRIASCKNKDLEKKINNFKPNKIFAIVTTRDVNKEIINKAIKKNAKIFVAKDIKDKIDSTKIHVLKFTDF